jgi:uncharacterized protein (DUF697 family)
MVTCEDRAQEWVHLYAAGGAAFAALPIPGATSMGLAAAESHMVYWIAKIYGEELSGKEITLILGTLGLASLGLKAFALEACNFIPVAGWLIKGGIAATAIESIGATIIRHFEQKYPGKRYTKDPAVESSVKRK